jgi:hypothetical protein
MIFSAVPCEGRSLHGEQMHELGLGYSEVDGISIVTRVILLHCVGLRTWEGLFV